jgi:hypothetical protein
MATQLRHPKSAVPGSTVLPRTRLKGLAHGVKPLRPEVTRPTAKLPSPRIGEPARLWDYVNSAWIEGTIEGFLPDYRILVRCSGELEETVGSYLAFRDGAWVEDRVGVPE